jgi:hypothetical protein
MSKSVNILGISAFYHDSAACLVRDGKIIAAAQEERFTRKKHDPAFPKNAVEYCLREGGIKISDVDYVAFYEKPFLKFDRLLHSYLAYAPSGLKTFLMAIPLWIRERIWMKTLIQEELPGFTGKILFPEHHESHAASAFFPSPYPNAAFLTVDGVGAGALAAAVEHAAVAERRGGRAALWSRTTTEPEARQTRRPAALLAAALRGPIARSRSAPTPRPASLPVLRRERDQRQQCQRGAHLPCRSTPPAPAGARRVGKARTSRQLLSIA